MNARMRALQRPLVLIGLYFAGAVLAALYLRTPGDITLFWPASGIAYAAVIRYGLRWAIVLPLTLLAFHPLFAPVPDGFLPYSIGSNMLGTLAAGWYVSRRTPLHLRTRDAMIILRGGLLLGVISATIGGIGLVATGMVPGDGFGEAWLLWLLGDLLGITTVAPSLLLLTTTRNPNFQVSPTYESTPARERAAWSLALLASFTAIYFAGVHNVANRLGLIGLPLMLLLWSAMRFSPAWNAVSTMLVVTYLSLVTGLGIGGFEIPDTLLDATVLLLLLLLIASIPMLLSLAGLEQRTTAQALFRRATRDTLTGLLNRNSFEEQARERLADETTPATLLYLDLDNFKVVNDSASHVAGDAMIRALAGILADKVMSGSLLARTGGDEFAMLLHCGRADAVTQARRLLGEIEALRLPWDNQVLTSTASIGVAPADDDNRDYDGLFSHADAACFSAKEMGGNRLVVADPDSDETRSRATAMRSAMRVREALEHKQFELFCQPILSLHDSASDDQNRDKQDGVHFEVLLRWRHPDGSLHTPAEFIAAAERFRLGPRLDRFVVDAVLGWLEAHPDEAARTHICSVNLSGATLVDEDFADYLGARLRRSAFPAERLCLEITETSVVRDRGRAQRFIRQMRGMGCRFALDDFGTGFCSFSYLRDLDVDFFKIDGSFVRDLDHSELAQAVVQSIADIAHVLGKATIAEQVETDTQRMRMQLMRVDFAQGYLFSKPHPIGNYFGIA